MGSYYQSFSLLSLMHWLLCGLFLLCSSFVPISHLASSISLLSYSFSRCICHTLLPTQVLTQWAYTIDLFCCFNLMHSLWLYAHPISSFARSLFLHAFTRSISSSPYFHTLFPTLPYIRYVYTLDLFSSIYHMDIYDSCVYLVRWYCRALWPLSSSTFTLVDPCVHSIIKSILLIS